MVNTECGVYTPGTPNVSRSGMELLLGPRSVDRAMRQAHAIPEVWDAWEAVLQTLDRLLDEVRD